MDINEGGFRYPSRFIFNIEKKLLNYIIELQDDLVEASTAFIEEDESKYNLESALKVNDSVLHKTFGVGKIMEVNVEQRFYLIQFENTETPRSISFSIPIKKVE